MTGPNDAAFTRFADEIGPPDATLYELTLFVSGVSDRSLRAIANARRMCEEHLAGRYRLSVIDMRDDPAAVQRDGVIAAPTLVKNWPLPVRRLVGDLSRTDKVLLALDLPAAPSGGTGRDDPGLDDPPPMIESPRSLAAASSDKAYLSAAEAARILNVSPKTMSRWAKEGKLGYLETLGGHRRFSRREVDLLAEQSVILPEVTAR